MSSQPVSPASIGLAFKDCLLLELATLRIDLGETATGSLAFSLLLLSVLPEVGFEVSAADWGDCCAAAEGKAEPLSPSESHTLSSLVVERKEDCTTGELTAEPEARGAGALELEPRASDLEVVRSRR